MAAQDALGALIVGTIEAGTKQQCGLHDVTGIVDLAPIGDRVIRTVWGPAEVVRNLLKSVVKELVGLCA